MKRIMFCLLMLIFDIPFAKAQADFSKNSLKFGLSKGRASFNTISYGNGYSFNIGFQRNLYKDRLRFNPDFNIGYYKTSRYQRDGPLSEFSSYSFSPNLYFDVLRYKAFSLILGSGPFVKYSHGYTENWPNPGYNINHLHFGAFAAAGIRINFKNKRFAFELLPGNLSFGTNKYFQSTISFGIDYKLK